MFINNIWVVCEYKPSRKQLLAVEAFLESLPEWERYGLESVTLSYHPRYSVPEVAEILPDEGNGLLQPIFLQWKPDAVFEFRIQAEESFVEKFHALVEFLEVSPRGMAEMAVTFGVKSDFTAFDRKAAPKGEDFVFSVGIGPLRLAEGSRRKKTKSNRSEELDVFSPAPEFVYGVEELHKRLIEKPDD